MGLVSAVWGALERSSVDQGRTSPVRLSSFIAPDPHAGSGGGLGRSRSIRRRMSANSDRGTATLIKSRRHPYDAVVATPPAL